MIRVSQLSKKFDHRAIAGISGISFSLPTGEILAIMGPNGSGKSTLLNILSSKMRADSGDFLIDTEIKMCDLTPPSLDIKVLDFLVQSVTLEIDQDKKIQLARDFADLFEFTFQLRQNFSTLSSGQTQKILLAKELINNPKIILLDEPFTHLDPWTRKDILKALFKYIKEQKMTVLWVTHERNEALYFADQIMLMNFGKIEQMGTPKELTWHPRNLFVAQYMGYENFISITKNGKDTWSTPWGTFTFPFPTKQNEALLIIPLDAWEIDPASPIKLKINQQKVQNHLWELKGDFQNSTLTLHIPEFKLKALPDFQELGIRPIWASCLMIEH